MSNPFLPLIQSYLPEPEASLLAGMLFGTRQGFSKEFYQALITTGTIHVVALSGMNISILVNLISKLTYPLGRKISSIVSILTITGFIFFVGPSATVVRAGIMGVLSLIAVYFGRQSLAMLSLFITGFLMIIFDFQIISNLSFQLSFLATLGILIFAPEARKVLKDDINFYRSLLFDIKNVFWENLRTTLAAQIATLPVIIFTFARVSLVAPLANLLIGWMVPMVTWLGLLISLTGLISYPLGQVLAWLVYVPLHYFVRVVEITSRLPFASITLR